MVEFIYFKLCQCNYYTGTTMILKEGYSGLKEEGVILQRTFTSRISLSLLPIIETHYFRIFLLDIFSLYEHFFASYPQIAAEFPN